MSLLEVNDLKVSLVTPRGRANAVDGLSFSLNKGEILGIAGESGSGKTMTALTLLDLLPDRAQVSGSVRFDGRELVGLKTRDFRRIRGKEIAMVFQDPMTSLHPMLSIELQLTEHLRRHTGVSGKQAHATALDLLATVRIPDPKAALKAHPSQFSGGMRQRIAIAMALACEPKLLLADEPTTALDVTVQAGILRLLDQLRRERDLSVIIITHDLGVLSAVTDRLLVMYAGREVESGSTSTVLQHPRHPYSRGLLDALPDAEASRLTAIAGLPPELGAFPTGCAFHPRCPYSTPACAAARPSALALDAGHRSFCPIDPLDPALAGAGERSTS